MSLGEKIRYLREVEGALRGLGREMMEAAEGRLHALGCPKINLQIYRSNAEVVRFYERLGYAVEDRISMGRRLE